MQGRILIIDDDPVIVEAMGARLGHAGYEVHSAVDGRAGLAAVEQLRPDVILLDIALPDIDGFEVNRRLKASPELAGIPVVFVSANVKDWAKRAAFAMGAKFYLSKPYDFNRLSSVVGAAVKAAPCPDGAKDIVHERQTHADDPDH
ncbi:hypothetical protein LCGC14_2428820 [marine sediment metagenome]|uniref:Response regulatory domain-containing protein n=1 Tax=marine sediment metagenome TaxID=412755 RepID=A0A0F9DZH8_9ZZZZ